MLRTIGLILFLAIAQAVALPAEAAIPPHVRFVIDGDSSREAAATCARIWQEEGADLVAELVPAGVSLDTVTCLILGTDEFKRRFAGSLPDWGVGVALSGGRLVAVDHVRLPAVGRGLRQVFLHEMVHALLFQSVTETWLPTWFHEGCAMRWSGEWRFSDTVSLALGGRVPRLERLQGHFPASAATADRAYRTSLLAVDWLEEKHGPGAVPAVLEATRLAGGFDRGFEAATGESAGDFAQAFAGRMRLRFGWLVLVTRWPTLFVLLALLLAVGAIRKLVVSRRRLAAMDDEEARPPA